MEKIKIRVDVGKEREFDAELSGPNTSDINDVIGFFTEAKNNGATTVEWYAKADYEGCSEYCQAQTFFYREETEEEVKARIEDLQKRKEIEEKRKLKEEQNLYLKLKQKFEPK